jgi:hypothetical protein
VEGEIYMHPKECELGDHVEVTIFNRRKDEPVVLRLL